MLTQRSIVVMIGITLLISSAMPVIVAAALGGNVVGLLAGLVVLALTVTGGAVWLARYTRDPLRQLSETAVEIAEAANAETVVEAITPRLRKLDAMRSSREFTEVAESFEKMVTVFEQRMTEFNSIYVMGQVITAKLDFEQTVQSVLEAMKQVVVFDAAEVSVLRADKLVVEAWAGQPEFNNTTGREYRVGRGPTGMIASNKASVLVSTISGEEEDLKRTLGYESLAGEFLVKSHKVMVNSFLGIPLLIGDRLIGTLTLVHREPGRFTESDRWQLNKLAAQASIAIDNAIQVRQREEVLKAQIRELRVEIDHSRINEEVEEITGSDYFQSLQSHAAKMRNRVYTRDARRKPQSDDATGSEGSA